jgi:hypothetical protein
VNAAHASHRAQSERPAGEMRREMEKAKRAASNQFNDGRGELPILERSPARDAPLGRSVCAKLRAIAAMQRHL